MCDDDQALVVLYAVVAVKSPTEPVRALAQYVAAAGNFQKVSMSLIEKLPIVDDKRTFVLHRYAFHVLVRDRLVFLALVEKGLRCPATMPFSFLEALSDWFFALDNTCPGLDDAAVSDQMNTRLRMEVDRYANDRQLHKIDMAKSQLQDTVDILGDNVKQMLCRNETLDVVIYKSEELANESRRFKRQARKVAHHFSCQALLSRILCLVMALGATVFVYWQVAACMQSQPSYDASKSSHLAQQREYTYYCQNLFSGYHWISSMEHDLENRSAVFPALEAAAKLRSQQSSHELARRLIQTPKTRTATSLSTASPVLDRPVRIIS